MNKSEISEFLSTSRVYFSAVNRVVAHGVDSSEDDGVRETRLRRWGLTLADVDADTAKRCLDAMHRGDAGHEDALQHLSDWADKFPSFVRRWCRSHRAPALGVPKYAEPDRYRCLQCRDNGTATVVNPHYTAEHRHAIDGNRLCPIDVNDAALMVAVRKWYRDAAAWCRANRAGHFVTSVVCDCDSPVAVNGRDRINSLVMNASVLRQKTMPVVQAFGCIGIREAVERYIDEVPFNEVYAWDASGGSDGWDP